MEPNKASRLRSDAQYMELGAIARKQLGIEARDLARYLKDNKDKYDYEGDLRDYHSVFVHVNDIDALIRDAEQSKTFQTNL